MSTEPQSAAAVMMVRPARFQGNLQTQQSNRFQVRDDTLSAPAAQAAALVEFDRLVEALRAARVDVHVFDDTLEPHTPDALFPNNWVSFHANGTAVLYPMLAENRRLERREDVLSALSTRHGFHISNVIDLTDHERNGQFLEGTGSLVLDRAHRIAYACLSPRTDLDVLGEFAQRLDYEVAAFEALDAGGAPVYHTNVLMCVGTQFATVCATAIESNRRAAIVNLLEATGHTVIDLSFDQIHAFAGNMLELRTRDGGVAIAMSETALRSLSASQRQHLESFGSIVAVPIPTIERLGGGSVRCMIAEVFLPKGRN